MKRKGFTLVELLVVIAIIALLMGILMPALARVRQIAYRMICGSNLSGIGRAMMVYAHDWDEEYPLAGGLGAIWTTSGTIDSWTDPLELNAFGTPGVDNDATISSSFYLLVKWADVQPKQFVCKGDVGTTVLKLSALGTLALELTDLWDFGGGPSAGGWPGEHNSYSLHMPYRNQRGSDGVSYTVTGVSNPGSPLGADRNPYLDKNADYYKDDAATYVTWSGSKYTDPDLSLSPPDDEKYGNSASHQREGQNVLFNDSHVRFERYPNVGIQNDNIWKTWSQDPPTSQQEREIGGIEPVDDGDGAPLAEKDAYLVNERQNDP